MAKKEYAAVIPLKEYVSQMEAKAQPLTVCDVTHPEAVNGAIHQGAFGGIRLHAGDTPSATFSDGSKH